MKVKATIVQTHRAYSLHLEMWKIKDLLSVWLLTFPFSEAPNKVPSANEYRFWLLDYTDYFLSSSSPLNNCCLWNPLCKKHMTLQHSYSSFVFNITASLWLHTMWGELQVRAGRWELKTQGAQLLKWHKIHRRKEGFKSKHYFFFISRFVTVPKSKEQMVVHRAGYKSRDNRKLNGM